MVEFRIRFACSLNDCFCVFRLKGVMEREKENESESGVIKDSPDSPEPFNKKPRLTLEDLQPQEKSKGKSYTQAMQPVLQGLLRR